MANDERNDVFDATSFLYGGNAPFIEDLYATYQQTPDAVPESWRDFFAQLKDDRGDVLAQAKGASWERPDWPVPENGELVSALDTDWSAVEEAISSRLSAKAAPGATPLSAEQMRATTLDSVRALMMIRAYRMRGHLAADLDPLKLEPNVPHPELQPETYGFGPQDLDRPIFIDHVLGLETATIREMVAILKRTYCHTIGVEFLHIADPEQKAWIQERIEGANKEVSFTPEGKKAILNKLVETEGFEKFLGVKYTGTKRFGLDGGEAMVPALEQIIKRGGNLGVEEIVLGMPHRGRLNVLVNVMAKSYRAIFNEFSGGASTPEEVEGSGDVKYHLGASSDREFDGNQVHLSLTANPSHLEIVDPVVLGKVRAKQDKQQDKGRQTVLPLLLHGDAAFAGQGVVAECLGLSGLRGHRTGGSIHFIVNNQIGFTTAPHFSRSSPYPSDVAKMVDAPIFHVNGDDPEAVTYAAKIAIEFRQKFNRPVVIDMFCYRRFGHNEGDEPAFTQPLMYKAIAKHPTTLEIYAEKLIGEGLLTAEDVAQTKADFRAFLEEEFAASASYKPNKADWLDGAWSGFGHASRDARRGETCRKIADLKRIGAHLAEVPKDFNAHRTIRRIMAARGKAIETGEGIDWSTAEALAFGTLLDEGVPVRLSGQDSERGTFSQRHSVLTDQETEEKYVPLNHVSETQGIFEVINSMLSEEAVLGFEYGYSLARPKALTLWEAQFGDFTNGAQVVIDQFISSGERKWLRMSGLVLLLPHGYEGQGPEHSSARLERFLQSCAEDNMQIANCTTASNYFHILRRQIHRKFRKPLVLMTPKSMLRDKRTASHLAEMGPDTTFHRVLWDDAGGTKYVKQTLKNDEKIRRVIMCSGKVYFDLARARDERGLDDIYILRLEQLYPFPTEALSGELKRFTNAQMMWVQEEPKNMGAWSFAEPNIEAVLADIGAKSKRPAYVGRAAMAATATGLMSKHLKQLDAFLAEALGD